MRKISAVKNDFVWENGCGVSVEPHMSRSADKTHKHLRTVILNIAKVVNDFVFIKNSFNHTLNNQPVLRNINSDGTWMRREIRHDVPLHIYRKTFVIIGKFSLGCQAHFLARRCRRLFSKMGLGEFFSNRSRKLFPFVPGCRFNHDLTLA